MQIIENHWQAADRSHYDWQVAPDGCLTELRHPQDPAGMNWVANAHADAHWGRVHTALPLTISVALTHAQGQLAEVYTFANDTAYDVMVTPEAIGIEWPLPDSYPDAATCLTQRCHAHLWCQGSASYVMAEKMGPSAYNLGLVLTVGALDGYSILRDNAMSSNDRGTFVVHPQAQIIHPGESMQLGWRFFWFGDRAEFHQQLPLQVTLTKPLALVGEHIGIATNVPATVVLDHVPHPTPYLAQLPIGEHCLTVTAGRWQTRVKVRVMPPLDELAAARCAFIVAHQQCHDPASRLNGAYLAYDNETDRQYYAHRNDYNGGRERVGMGVLLATYLQRHPDAKLQASLDAYVAYVLRELFDDDTGEVFNDVAHAEDFRHGYNYPWLAVLFWQLARLKHDRTYLGKMVRCLRYFYAHGGAKQYVINLPMQALLAALAEAGMIHERRELLADFVAHGQQLLANGLAYPAHEVNYEQSIVAPACLILQELANITGEARFGTGAKQQLAVLRRFSGEQPDYHLQGVAIRHWDGYWFGKRRLYGDTFPHYWSALSGWALSQAQDPGADTALRAPLSLFEADGTAHCAYLYPRMINDQRGEFAEPLANDQDWGLYFMLMYGTAAW